VSSSSTGWLRFAICVIGVIAIAGSRSSISCSISLRASFDKIRFYAVAGAIDPRGGTPHCREAWFAG